MPLYVSGDLRIAVSADIGDFGPAAGQPVNYRWNAMYHVTGLLPWLMTACAFLVFRENRRAAALLILLPVLAVIAIWAAYTHVVTISSSVKDYYDVLFTAMIAGLTLFGLLMGRLGKARGLVIIFILVALLTLLYALQQAIILGFAFSFGLFWGINEFLLTLGTIIPALVLTRFVCREKFSYWRFVLVYAGGLAIFAAIAYLLLVPLSIYVWHYSIWSGLGGSFTFWLEQFLLCALISIPYLALMFTNGFWRERFEKVFGITIKPAVVSSEPVEPSISVSQ